MKNTAMIELLSKLQKGEVSFEQAIASMAANGRGLVWTEDGQPLADGKLYKTTNGKTYSIPQVDAGGNELKMYYRGKRKTAVIEVTAVEVPVVVEVPVEEKKKKK